jgi:transcriptional regulator with XRE-family HTH domain
VTFLPTRLKEAREASGLTQEQLAAGARLSPETIRRAEGGQRISIANARKICETLKSSVDHLTGTAVRQPAEALQEFSRSLIADAVSENLRSAHAIRISIKTLFSDDDGFHDRFEAIQRKLFPTLAEAAVSRLNELTALFRINAIENELRSHTFQFTIDKSIVEEARLKREDADIVYDFFSTHINTVSKAVDSILYGLRDFTHGPTSKVEEGRKAAGQSVMLQVETLFNRVDYAFVAGQHIFSALGLEFNPLRARGLEAAPPELIARHEALIEKKQKYLDEMRRLADKSLDEFAAIERMLDINDADKPNEVIGKATFLRNVGRIEDAVRAFHRYGELFETDDPNAFKYAYLGKAFSQSIKRLGVSGGIYVYEVREGGPEFDAGLQVGDIIVSIASRPVPDMMALTAVYADLDGRDEKFDLLRYENVSGAFVPVSGTLKINAILRGVCRI